MFLINSIANKNYKTVFGVKEQGATCPKHHPATKITCLAHGLLLDCQQRNYKMFSGSNSKLLQYALCFFIFMLSHVIQTKSNYKMVSQPNHINPHTAFKKLLCYKMSCLGTFLKPCFADKVDYIVRPGPLAVCS